MHMPSAFMRGSPRRPQTTRTVLTPRYGHRRRSRPCASTRRYHLARTTHATPVDLISHVVFYQLRTATEPDLLGRTFDGLTATDAVVPVHHGRNISPLGLAAPWGYSLRDVS